MANFIFAKKCKNAVIVKWSLLENTQEEIIQIMGSHSSKCLTKMQNKIKTIKNNQTKRLSFIIAS